MPAPDFMFGASAHLAETAAAANAAQAVAGVNMVSESLRLAFIRSQMVMGMAESVASRVAQGETVPISRPQPNEK